MAIVNSIGAPDTGPGCCNIASESIRQGLAVSDPFHTIDEWHRDNCPDSGRLIGEPLDYQPAVIIVDSGFAISGQCGSLGWLRPPACRYLNMVRILL